MFYQINGSIFDTVKPNESIINFCNHLFEGDCFVFTDGGLALIERHV
ncbi:Uncharacterised protein [Chryseobacterium taihuense]|uniref:Uncharacterized protein n=1 Tax=Chryseobacterium taihuense TaxID=1141221 RepID=A0A4U8W7H3_9FLAO|nr:Uncharacterised protein [Chryseobacterium taihuense]